MLDRTETRLPSHVADVLDRATTVSAVLAQEAATADEECSLTPQAWEALVDSGLLMAAFPLELGGDDLGTRSNETLLAVLRRFGAADLSLARLFEGHVNAVLLIRRFGTEDQLEELAASVSAGTLSGVWGADGSKPLEARRTEKGWDLIGHKIMASGAGLATRPVVPVATDGGHLMFMPDLRGNSRIDLSGWTAQGMRSSATGTVDFSGIALTDRDLVGRPGDFMRQPWFSGGAWRFCAVHLGAAERLVDLFRDHLVSRKRDDDPYQLQRIAQATVAVATAGYWIADAARRVCEDPNPDRVVAFANLTRGVTERAALDVLELVHRGVGLVGFLRPNPIERISRDLATYLRQPVPDLAMADAARTVLRSRRTTAALWDDGAL